MYSKNTNQERFDWLESVEDGLLTLQAERLLFRVPPEVVPTFTTLYTPDLINIAVGNLNADYIFQHSSGFDELAQRFSTVADNEDCFGVTDRIHIERIKYELECFATWFRHLQNHSDLETEPSQESIEQNAA